MQPCRGIRHPDAPARPAVICADCARRDVVAGRSIEPAARYATQSAMRMTCVNKVARS